MPRKTKPQPKAAPKARPDLAIVYRDPAELKPDPRNVRKHSKEQIALIVDSISKYGFGNPILLKPGDVIGAGHARWQAARQMKLAKVPTIKRSDLSDKDWRAYMIVDNKLAETGSTWDKALLAEELTELKALDVDLGAMGFGTGELASLGVVGFSLDATQTVELPPPEVSIIIICKDEAHQEKLLARFTKEGLTCRALL